VLTGAETGVLIWGVSDDETRGATGDKETMSERSRKKALEVDWL
jgi:hypothetical protein